jgi:hypothetical protein
MDGDVARCNGVFLVCFVGIFLFKLDASARVVACDIAALAVAATVAGVLWISPWPCNRSVERQKEKGDWAFTSLVAGIMVALLLSLLCSMGLRKIQDPVKTGAAVSDRRTQLESVVPISEACRSFAGPKPCRP